MSTMKKRAAPRFPQIILVAMFLSFLGITNVHCFQGHHQSPRRRVSTRHSNIVSPYQKLKYTRSTLFQSQGVEEDFRFIRMEENQTSTSTSKRRWLSRRTWSQAVRVDRKHIAELGISFMLTYNMVSNINGSIFMSLAWYITSIRVSQYDYLSGGYEKKGSLG